ncbi:MAG: hypothetical protein ACJ72Z_00255 [Pyrinomonadaceae bacterium]
MKNFTIKATLAIVFLGGLIFTGAVSTASAQGNSQWAHEKNRIRKEQKAQERYYRVYRNGSYYQTDNRGVDLLRQAVSEGYRQGYRQGQIDRRYDRHTGYRASITYRNAIGGYQDYVDRGQYQYYFRQGFERGYDDGFSSASRYGYQTGSGVWNILGNVLGSILDIRPY